MSQWSDVLFSKLPRVMFIRGYVCEGLFFHIGYGGFSSGHLLFPSLILVFCFFISWTVVFFVDLGGLGRYLIGSRGHIVLFSDKKQVKFSGKRRHCASSWIGFRRVVEGGAKYLEGIGACLAGHLAALTRVEKAGKD